MSRRPVGRRCQEQFVQKENTRTREDARRAERVENVSMAGGGVEGVKGEDAVRRGEGQRTG